MKLAIFFGNCTSVQTSIIIEVKKKTLRGALLMNQYFLVVFLWGCLEFESLHSDD